MGGNGGNGGEGNGGDDDDSDATMKVMVMTMVVVVVMMMVVEVEVTQMHLLYPDASPPYILQLIPGFWCTNPIPLKMFIHFWHFFLIFSLQKSVWTNIFELNSFCALPQNLAITVMCALKTKSRIMGCESIFPGAHYILVSFGSNSNPVYCQRSEFPAKAENSPSSALFGKP